MGHSCKGRNLIVARKSMVLGEEVHKLNLHDVVLNSPETRHQFHADQGESLGFICIVDRYRDKPTLPDEEYIAGRITSDAVRKKILR
jgi:hypothetical protein